MSKVLEEYKQLCRELNEFDKNKIPLCAAETYISDFSKQALISNFEGKYSFVDTNGNNDFVGGTYVFRLNELLKKECQLLFNAKYTNADTATGINCFTVCAMSLLKNTDSVLITTPDQGGHASIPIILNKLCINYEAIPYDYDNFQIDYEQLNNLCKSGRYNFLIFCQSDIINPPDMSKISLPDSMGIIYDGTQTLGLIAAGVLENPLENINNIILIGGAHKTLPAPACGLIMTNCNSYQQCLQTNITPNYLRNTQPNHIAALLLALIEQENFGKLYQNLTVKTANQLAKELSVLGFNVAKLKSNKYTYTHQLFILMNQSDTNDFYRTAEKYNITLNKKHKRLFANDGIRIGTQEIARYNWNLCDIKMLAQLLYAIKNHNEQAILDYRKHLISLKTPTFTFEDISIK